MNHENITIYCQSLGCDKNLSDSEHFTGVLGAAGYSFSDAAEDADIAIINTCCFIHDAKQESVDEILQLAALKDQGLLKGIIVTGCLAQRYQEEIRAQIPQVDAILGTMAGGADIKAAVEEVLSARTVAFYPDINMPLPKGEDFLLRELSTGGHYAYLKIAEGCDRRCTYCIIPHVRGRYRSIPMEELLKEARALAAKGVKELIIIAQETTLYGRDLYGRKSLPELLKKLCAIDGIEWIRILYAYPEEIDDELIETIASEEKICHYLDMPIQHCNDEVLRRMGRHVDKGAIEAVIERLRSRIPDIILRTTLITGFPGETREQYEELYRFVNDTEFDRLGVFTYSREEGTPAALMEDQVPEEEAIRRRDELMELQQAVVFDMGEERAQAHPVMKVFIEGYLPEDGVYVGRTYMDAPDVDGLVFVSSERELMSGDIICVRITKSDYYDLIGEEIDEPS